jgi:hypothetical protein
MFRPLGRLAGTTVLRIRRTVAGLRHRPADVLAITLVAALPLVLLAANSSWIWDNPDFNDTSVYVGFFRRYLEHKLPFTANYKSSRLPWVLPGVALYHWLPAAAAHHVLYLTFLIGEAVLLFMFARRRFGVQVAFLVAAAAVTSTFAHERTSYHDQAAGTYLVAALVLLERPARWPLLLRLALAGGTFALDVTTDAVVVVAFGPLFLLFAAAAVGPKATAARWVAAAGALLAGAVGALAVVGALNVALGGPFLFFMEQVEYSRAIAQAKGLSYTSLAEILASLPTYPMLVLPTLAAAGAVLLLIRQAARRRFDAAALPAIGLLLSFGAAVLMQVRGLGGLEHEALFQPFHVPIYLALGGMLGGLRQVAPARASFFFVVASLFILPLAGFGARISRLLEAHPPTAGGAGLASALVILLAVLVTVARVARRRRTARRLVFSALGLGLINAICTSSSQPAYMYQAGAPCLFREETFDALIEVDDALDAWDPHHIAEFASDSAPLLAPVWNGWSWCETLPLGLVSNAVLLPRYFYTSAELARGWPEPRIPKKFAVAAMSPEGLNEVVNQLAKALRPDQRFEASVNKTFIHRTFVLFLLGLDVAPP